MARPSSAMIYYSKVFFNARRCLKEARAQMHPDAKRTMRLKNPKSGEPEEVMELPLAISWAITHHLPTWSQNTWRMHRCGYRALLDKMLKSQRISEDDAQRLKDKMQSVFGLKKGERVKKTSSRRKKVVSPEHIDQIEAYVTEKNSKWGPALVIWLRAAIVTGLRPNEWQTAKIEERNGETILISENFKHNEERSYAEFREIKLSGFPDEIVHCVKQQVAVVQGFIGRGEMSDYYTGCSSLLYACNKALWPRRKANINLYTGRHQFSANAKADESVSDVQRAALMGHKTTKTSREGYGKTRSGSKGLTPEVANENVLGLIRDDQHQPAPQNQPANRPGGASGSKNG